MSKQYDPYWPFPQYDENGKQLLPPPAPKQKKPAYPEGAEEAPF